MDRLNTYANKYYVKFSRHIWFITNAASVNNVPVKVPINLFAKNSTVIRAMYKVCKGPVTVTKFN